MNTACLLESSKKRMYEQWFLVIKTTMTTHHFTIKPQVLNIMVGNCLNLSLMSVGCSPCCFCLLC